MDIISLKNIAKSVLDFAQKVNYDIKEIELEHVVVYVIYDGDGVACFVQLYDDLEEGGCEVYEYTVVDDNLRRI